MDGMDMVPISSLLMEFKREQEGYYVIQSKEYFPENKKFFYNTKDYWNSYYDAKTGQIVIGGFEFVSTTQRVQHHSISSIPRV